MKTRPNYKTVMSIMQCHCADSLFFFQVFGAAFFQCCGMVEEDNRYNFFTHTTWFQLNLLFF